MLIIAIPFRLLYYTTPFYFHSENFFLSLTVPATFTSKETPIFPIIFAIKKKNFFQGVFHPLKGAYGHV